MEPTDKDAQWKNMWHAPSNVNLASNSGKVMNNQAPPGFSSAQRRGEYHRTSGRPESPVRPPVSPISPKVTPAHLATPPAGIQNPYSTPPPAAIRNNSEPNYVPKPAPLPIDSEDSIDATALKATISMLQLQKAKNEQDIRTLTRLKSAAGEDPEAFLKELESGNLTTESHPSNPLQATLGGNSDEENDDCGCEASKFPKIPQPQEIARCPPINWAKYHVVGESLDRMHEEQRRRPTAGAPPWSQPRDHVVSASYSPFVDNINNESPAQSKGGAPK